MGISSIQFSDHPILGNLHIDFRDVEGHEYQNVMFVGENGCGKTMILKGIIEDVKGKARPLNKEVESFFVPQDLKYTEIMDKIASTIQPLNKNGHTKDNKVHKDYANNAEELFNNPQLTKFLRGECKLDDIVSAATGKLAITTSEKDDVFIDTLSSGEQELILRSFYIAGNIRWGTTVVAVDEIETALHPRWQLKVLSYIRKCIGSKQLFVASHSENILKSAIEQGDWLIVQIYRDGSGRVQSERINTSNLVLPFVTFAEVQNLVFGIPTIEYHISLYGYLHTLSTPDGGLRCFDNWLKDNSAPPIGDLPPSTHKGYENESLPTYIRNYINHPNEDNRSKNCMIRLTESIEYMQQAIRRLAIKKL
jgi:ABC-type cobalamin/Fe3+-siderophores transport system ATPase subunit